jgi:N-acetylglucosamine-6-phosphate deacetylase
VDRLLTAGEGTVAMVTVAPELPGGLAAIDQLVAAGVVVAVGHTNGDAEVVRQAVGRGATVATHLFNAMPPIHHRKPGPIPVLLDDDQVMVELIADGRHLHDDVLRMAVAAAGPGRVGLVTDAMLAAGMPDGSFRLGGLAVEVQGGTARLAEGPDAGTIAGSTLTMAGAFAHLVGLGFPIADVARMAAMNPARWHRLDAVGTIEVGRQADLCVVDERGTLQRVMQAGAWVAAS